ncbi:MAG: methyltransferase type 11, partial [Gemmatimonadota bacterium]
TWVFNYPGPASGFVDAFRHSYGPTMNAFDAAGKNGRGPDLLRELEELFGRQNTSSDRNTASIPATFLRVTVMV